MARNKVIEQTDELLTIKEAADLLKEAQLLVGQVQL